MKSDGEVLKAILHENGIQYGHLAKKLGVHRNTVTRLLNEPVIAAERLLQIGKILRIDILKRFPRLEKDLSEPEYISGVEEPRQPLLRRRSLEEYEKELLDLQRKYIALLEIHNELLTKLSTGKQDPAKDA